MNEVLTDFTEITSQDNQNKMRLDLVRYLRTCPMSIMTHSKSIGISGNSLGTFLRGGKLGRISLMKIARFIEELHINKLQSDAISTNSYI